jgi:hypothetical protein
MKVNRKSKWTWAAGAGTAVVLTLGGISACTHANNGSTAESKQQGNDTTQILNNQPLPNINWSQWRQDLISVELAEANDTATTSFVMHQGNQDPVFSCPSIGFPIPVTASLSNPLAPYQGPVNTGADDPVVGQMDPNGVYMPPGGEGTWVVCLDSSGMPYINYAEDNVDAPGGPAVWNYKTHSYSLVGAPTVGVALIPPAKAGK